MAINKIKSSNIDLDDLSNELINSHSFINSSTDIEQIGDIKTQFIAKAATITNDGNEYLVDDNNLVQRTLELYDVDKKEAYPINKLMTKDESVAYVSNYFDNTQHDTNIKLSNELLDIKNELYSLISKLNKKKILNKYTAIDGFIELFNEENPQYDIAELCNIVQVGQITSGYTNHIYIAKTNAALINKDFWYIVKKHYASEDLYELVYVTSITTSSESDIVDLSIVNYNYDSSGLNLNNSDNLYDETVTLSLFSVHGNYINNTFSFSEKSNYVSTGITHEISFDDDTQTALLEVINNVDDFAVTYKVPANKVGTIKTFSVYGTPIDDVSSLQCYILKDADMISNSRHISELYNNNDPTILYRSNIVNITDLNIDENGLRDYYKITFDFKDEIDGKYKCTLSSDKYTFVIVAVDKTASGYWRFRFSRNSLTDDEVQTNNKCYTYSYDLTQLTYNYTQKTHNADLMFSTITEDILNEQELGFKNGVYTSKEFQINNNITDISAYLTINREGLFCATQDYTINGSNNDAFLINFDSDTSLANIINKNTLGYNYGLKTNDTLIVGNNILSIKKENTDNRIYISEDNVNIFAKDKVYKCGYKISLLLYDNSSDTNYIYPLTLTKILNNPDDSIPNASDILVFKSEELQEKASVTSLSSVVFNKAKIVIAWQSDAPENYFEKGSYNNDNFIGRIYNLVVTTSNVNKLEDII